MEKQKKKSLYWCHICKIQFMPQNQIVCSRCNNDFCEEITQQNNPKNYEPYEVHRERPRNLTRIIQRNISFNPTNLGNFPPLFQQIQNQYFQNVMQFLRRIDQTSYGSPPASKQEIQKLQKFKYKKQMIQKGFQQCSVCKEQFKQTQQLYKMPCKHLYHQKCIIPWLQNHNSCPSCRFELKTDNQQYQARKNKKK